MNHLIKLDDIRHKANVRINIALTNKWLDDETIREFIKEQTTLQRYPFLLQKLYDKVRNEIRSRVINYGT